MQLWPQTATFVNSSASKIRYLCTQRIHDWENYITTKTSFLPSHWVYTIIVKQPTRSQNVNILIDTGQACYSSLLLIQGIYQAASLQHTLLEVSDVLSFITIFYSLGHKVEDPTKIYEQSFKGFCTPSCKLWKASILNSEKYFYRTAVAQLLTFVKRGSSCNGMSTQNRKNSRISFPDTSNITRNDSIFYDLFRSLQYHI